MFLRVSGRNFWFLIDHPPATRVHMICWFPRPYGAGIKREHGEAYPSGTDTVAAPATVSGERNPIMPLASISGVGKAGKRSDPRARRPA